jgi:hypothetical protein
MNCQRQSKISRIEFPASSVACIRRLGTLLTRQPQARKASPGASTLYACIRRLVELWIPSLCVKNDMGFTTSILTQHFAYHEIVQPACGCRRHISSPWRGFASLGLTHQLRIRACGSRRQRPAWTRDVKIHGTRNPMLKCHPISQLTKPARAGTGRKINVIHESPLPHRVRHKRTGSSYHKDTSTRYA